jgi:hypothetical protein
MGKHEPIEMNYASSLFIIIINNPITREKSDRTQVISTNQLIGKVEKVRCYCLHIRISRVFLPVGGA